MYRRVGALPRAEGFRVDHERVARRWRREGLEVPQRRPARRRPNGGSCVRLRTEHPGRVWGYDVAEARTSDGRALRLLAVTDEYARECLAIDVARRVTADDVPGRLSDRVIRRGVPAHVRSDNGPEFAARAARRWLGGWA